MQNILKQKVNMLDGPLLKNIVLYTIPVILTGILQLLFNAADLIVVGRYCGGNSVGAVGSTNSLVNLLVNLFLGFSAGVGVVTSNAIGAKNKKAVFNTVHTAIPLAIVCGIILSFLGVFFSKPVLVLMKTPKAFINLSISYVQIYFYGITFMLLYNFGAAILRAVGDTKSPLIYLTISGVINVILNIIFVKYFNLNVVGVALATTISQAISAVLVIIKLIRRSDDCKLYINKIKFYKKPLVKIIKIGFPAGIQSSLFSISNVIIQSTVNSFGAAAVSGAAAASSIEGFVYIIMNAFHQTAINFVGQNEGAKNYKRIKQIAKVSLVSVGIVGIVCGGLCFLFAKDLLSIYITDSSEAIKYGFIKISFIALPYFVCGLNETSTGLLRGLGSSLAPMLISVLGICGFRLFWIFAIFPIFNTYSCLMASYMVSWFLTFTAQLILFIMVLNKRQKQYGKKV